MNVGENANKDKIYLISSKIYTFIIEKMVAILAKVL